MTDNCYVFMPKVRIPEGKSEVMGEFKYAKPIVINVQGIGCAPQFAPLLQRPFYKLKSFGHRAENEKEKGDGK